MSNGFGRYLPKDLQGAAAMNTPGYRRGFGRLVDGSQDAANTKRSQLAALRRERIRAAVEAGSIRFDANGRAEDPLADDPAEIERQWRVHHDPDSVA